MRTFRTFALRNYIILTLSFLALIAVVASGLSVASSSSGPRAPRSSPLKLTAAAGLRAAYSGSARLVGALQSDSAKSRALASADLDQDGAPDVVAGYAYNGRGIVTVQRGNPDAFAPKDESVFQRMQDGYNPDPLLPMAETYIAPEPVDFLQVGNFNQDTLKDILVATRGGGLYMMPGDGRGGVGAPEQIALTGTVTALTTGEFNAADGRTDVAVGISGNPGPALLIFQDPIGQLRGAPLAFQLKSEAVSIQFGALDDDAFQDLAVAAGSEITIIHGYGRKTKRYRSRASSLLPFRIRSGDWRLAISYGRVLSDVTIALSR